MQIFSIELKNIKSHRQRSIDFSPGINVLSGANGVGKSTIFEAVGYTLFGVDAQKFVGNIERFISIGAKKGEIAVDFEVGDGERFKVTRTVGAGSKWLLHKRVGDAYEVEEHAGAGETETRLKELLGLDNGRSLAEQFELVIGPFQNEFLGPFVIRQPSKRRDEFDKILGIDAWRKTFKETIVLTNTIKTRVEVLQAEIAGRQDQVAILPEKKVDLQSTIQGLDLATKEMTEKEALLKKTEQQLAQLDDREQSINALSGDIKVLDGRISDGGQKIALQKERLAEAQQARDAVERTRGGMETFERAEKLLVELREKEKQRLELEREVALLDKDANGLRQRLDSEAKAIDCSVRELSDDEVRLANGRERLQIDDDLQSLAAQLPQLSEDISVLGEELGRLKGRRAGLEEGSVKLAEGVCPFFQERCKNVIDQEPRDVFTVRLAGIDAQLSELQLQAGKLEQDKKRSEEARQRIEAIRIQIKGLDQQQAALEERRVRLKARQEGLEQLTGQHAAAAEALEGHRRRLEIFTGLEADIEKAERERVGHQEARNIFVAHQKIAEDLCRRQSVLAEYESLLGQLKESRTARQGELDTLRAAYDAEAHRQKRMLKEALLSEVGVLRQKAENLNREGERLKAEIEKLGQLEKEIVAKKTQVRSFAEKDKLVKFLRNKVFKNVSGYLSERFREEISQRADRIYRTIAEADEELFWGEDYRVVLRDMVDGEIRERSDDQLSGGQMMSAVVALRLALLQTIGARIAFFDEPTSNLDATRRENLAHAFRAIDVGREEVTEHWYDQLFLISHDVAFTEVTDQVVPIESPS